MGGEPAGRFDFLQERLSVGELALLNHLIACPWCSGDFLIDLAIRKGPELLLREGMPPATEAAPRAIAEFESRSWADWVHEAETGNVDRSDLLRLVLRASREMQLSDPKRSLAIALAVFEQREWLSSMPERQDLQVEAMALVVNAARLCKIVGLDYGEVIEAAFVEGASLGARARYRRAKGLMLWHEGALEAADQHLVRAAMDFCRAGEAGEEGATMTLLGLLLQEKGTDEEEPGCFLMAGLAGMPRGQWPWLEARGLLALATAWARGGGRQSLSRRYLQHAETHYGNVISSDPHLLWARGKALAAVMETSLAAAQLAEARDRMIARRRFGEAVLVTLDLTYAKVQEGAVAWAAADVERLARQLAEEPSAPSATALMGWWDENVDTPLESRWAALERTLFMELRADGPCLEPLPFV